MAGSGRAGSCLESIKNWKIIKKCSVQNCSTTNIKDFIALFAGIIWLRRMLSLLAMIRVPTGTFQYPLQLWTRVATIFHVMFLRSYLHSSNHILYINFIKHISLCYFSFFLFEYYLCIYILVHLFNFQGCIPQFLDIRPNKFIRTHKQMWHACVHVEQRNRSHSEIMSETRQTRTAISVFLRFFWF